MQTRTDSDARQAIFESIRSHLATSKALDAREDSIKHKTETSLAIPIASPINDLSALVEFFKTSLEAVDGHCVVVHDEAELTHTLTNIMRHVRKAKSSLRVAVSDNPDVQRLVERLEIDLDELVVTPSSSDVFRFDIGISLAQAGIAETGTLVLDSARERHRLVSLVPPVHIAILDASKIVATLGTALSMLQQEEQVSEIVTFVTGPSRTADIELTLAIGVHGPQELFVVIRA